MPVYTTLCIYRMRFILTDVLKLEVLQQLHEVALKVGNGTQVNNSHDKERNNAFCIVMYLNLAVNRLPSLPLSFLVYSMHVLCISP